MCDDVLEVIWSCRKRRLFRSPAYGSDRNFARVPGPAIQKRMSLEQEDRES